MVLIIRVWLRRCCVSISKIRSYYPSAFELQTCPSQTLRCRTHSSSAALPRSKSCLKITLMQGGMDALRCSLPCTVLSVSHPSQSHTRIPHPYPHPHGIATYPPPQKPARFVSASEERCNLLVETNPTNHAHGLRNKVNNPISSPHASPTSQPNRHQFRQEVTDGRLWMYIPSSVTYLPGTHGVMLR